MEEICEFCGDPATERCTRKHREWIIIRPFELKKGDVLLRPDSKMYSVENVRRETNPRFSDPDTFIVGTGQRDRFVILYAELPILVKRETVCDWPTCGLHCTKCMRYAEAEERRDRLLHLYKPEKSRRRKVTEKSERRVVAATRSLPGERETKKRSHDRFPEGSKKPTRIKAPGKRRSDKGNPKKVVEGLTPNV
jgi:hypothetical protein